MNISEYTDAMNKLFWYNLTPAEQWRLKEAIIRKFSKKAYGYTNKTTFACKQGIGG